MMDETTDPRELRKHIQRCAFRGNRIDGKDSRQINITSSMARNVLSFCELNGYSGEDTMTVLAFMALKNLEQTTDRELAMLDITLKPQFLVAGIVGASTAFQSEEKPEKS